MVSAAESHDLKRPGEIMLKCGKMKRKGSRCIAHEMKN